MSILISAELSRINKGRCRQSRWFVTEHGTGRNTVQLFIEYNGLSLHLAIHHHLIPEINWASVRDVKYSNVAAGLEYSDHRSLGSGWEHPQRSFLLGDVSSVFGKACSGLVAGAGQLHCPPCECLPRFGRRGGAIGAPSWRDQDNKQYVSYPAVISSDSSGQGYFRPPGPGRAGG